MPTLLPAAKPRLATRRTSTSSNSRSIASGVPSVEALSTTIHSACKPPSEARAERSVRSASSRPLWVTTTTLRSGALAAHAVTARRISGGTRAVHPAGTSTEAAQVHIAAMKRNRYGACGKVRMS